MSEITRESIAANIASIRESIAKVKAESGASQDVLLMGVSKTVGIEEVAYAIEAGIHDFGENRVSELVAKSDAYPDENWHMIGRIQTNKLKDVVGRACLIHSVASIHAIDTIEKLAGKAGISQSILIEVNVSGEESKDGFTPEEVASALAHCSELSHVEVKGLMTMAPLGQPEAAHQTFEGLKLLRDSLAAEYNVYENIDLGELSMGMSQDYFEAIPEGATIIRLGRSIFS